VYGESRRDVPGGGASFGQTRPIGQVLREREGTPAFAFPVKALLYVCGIFVHGGTGTVFAVIWAVGDDRGPGAPR
jgi:hypothetical protein